MSFLSIPFWIFIIVLLVVYYIVPQKWQWPILLAGSYLFYLFAGYKTFAFILIVTYLTYFVGIYFGKINKQYEEYLQIHTGLTKYEKRDVKEVFIKKKRGILLAAVIINFSFLFLFKYFNIIESIGQLFADIWHIDNVFSGINVILPLGISYYTFQAIGYVIDVYRNKYAPEKNLAKYALFVAFFPQLVQGPISRYDELSMQLFEPRRLNYKNLTFGFQLMLWGYFKKLVVGVRLTTIVSTIMQNPMVYPGLYIILAMLLGWLELYIDFSAGVDIARGVAQTFGINMPQNFLQPFFSQSVGEFWRRWHVTLNNWWRDYIFYPLTLSKKFNAMGKFFKRHLGNELGKKIPVFFALIIVRILNSLWHGGTTVYLVSGLYHGMLVGGAFLLESQLRSLTLKLHIDTERRSWRLFRIIRTYILISIPEIMSYCNGIRDVSFRIKGLFSQFNPWIFFDDSLFQLGVDRKEWYLMLFALAIVFIVDRVNEKGQSVRERIARQNLVLRWCVYYALIFGIIIFGAYGAGYNAADFVYAQF